jgi:hypothetical protein
MARFPFDSDARHVLALDGGGVRGILTLHMLVAFEEHFQILAREAFDFYAGTSTGGITASLLAFGRKSAREVLDLYDEMIGRVFEPGFSSSKYGRLISRRMYRRDDAVAKLKAMFGDTRLGDLRTLRPENPQAIMLTTHDLVRNEELFLSSYPFKTGKPNLALDWKVSDAVAASAFSAPWYFGPWEGRYIDGGTTVFNTPARQAAFEALDYCAQPAFAPGKTIVWSFGTGSFASTLQPGDADGWWPWNWAQRLMSDIQGDAEADQLYGCRRLAERGEIEFRRFNVAITPESMEKLGIPASDVPNLPIGLDCADTTAFLHEVGKRAAAEIVW